MKKLLIIDDEISICNVLRFAFESEYEIYSAINMLEVNDIIREHKPSIVLLDLKFGNVSGLDLLDKIKRMYPDTLVIMMTAYGTIETSIQAIKKGAYDYILKPIDLDKLREILTNALRYQELHKKVLISALDLDENDVSIIGNSPKIKQVFEMINRVRDLNVNVLIQGESGTGKELVARAIHYSGSRVDKPYEVVNCGAIPENLIESELFGYEKGAFTGANESKKGRFEIANGGTIFLDEIGELNLYCQVKLLRAIQHKEISPLGSTSSKNVDVRIIAATNRDLSLEVEKGNFRKDLYFRLNVVPIYIPSLNERREDIPLLVDYFIQKANSMYGISIKGVTKGALEKLGAHRYTGNIRELENIIYRACILSSGEFIDENCLPGLKCLDESQSYDDDIKIKMGTKLEDAEKHLILSTLEFVNGNKAKASRILGISERSIHNKIKHYLGE